MLCMVEFLPCVSCEGARSVACAALRNMANVALGTPTGSIPERHQQVVRHTIGQLSTQGCGYSPEVLHEQIEASLKPTR
jgi:hypothetical protein